eukprot:scaffold12377_cov75-Skeletonema_marinoi.AAC.1
MSQLSKKSDLPKSKLSSRDAYLFKLSSRAAKKEECRRRLQQKERAYSSKSRWIHRSGVRAPRALYIRGNRKGNVQGLKTAARNSRKKAQKRPKKKNSAEERTQ